MKVKKLGILMLTALLACNPLLAHGGRTDGSGGHRDNKNASGLGSYHYHCGGNPAHLHENGVCPYDSNTSASSSNVSNVTPTRPTTPTYQEKQVSFRIDGNAATLTAVEVNGTNLVELKSLCDKLGITINYDASTKQIKGTKGDNNFLMTIGSKSATINGNYTVMTAAPIAINGRTMVPARIVAEAVGKTVTMDGNTIVIA